MMKLRTLLTSAIVLGAIPVFAATTGPFSTQRLSDVDKMVSSDAFQGRGTAAPIEPTVIDYIAGSSRQPECSPVATSSTVSGPGSRTCRCSNRRSSARPRSASTRTALSFRSNRAPRLRVLAPLNGAKQVDIDNAPLVFAGYGVDAPERGWNDFKGEDMHGKVLVVLVNDPDFEAAADEPVMGKFGGKAMTYYGRWTYKYEEAARHGAAGVIIIHETAPASYGWDVVQNSNTNAQFDIVRDNPAAAHTPFESWIQRPLAVQLFQRSGLDFEQAKARGAARRLPADSAQGDPVGAFRRRAAGDHQPQCRRHPAGQQISRRDDHLFSALGSSWGRQARRDRRPHLQRRGRQRRPAYPSWSSRRVSSRMGRGPSARSSSSRSPARRRACSARAIMRPTRSIRSAKTVADLNVDAWIPDGLQKNFTIRGTAKLDLPTTSSPKASARAATSRPIRIPKPAASTAPTISPSQSRAFPR